MECLVQNQSLFDMFGFSNSKHELIYEMIINHDSLSDNYFLIILTGNNKDIAFDAESSFWWDDEIDDDFIPPKIRNWKTLFHAKSLKELEQNISKFDFSKYYFVEENGKEIKVTEKILNKNLKKGKLNIQEDIFINNFKYSPGYCINEFTNEFKLVYNIVSKINNSMVDRSVCIKNTNMLFKASAEDNVLRKIIVQTGLNYNRLAGRNQLMYHDEQLYAAKKIVLDILKKELCEVKFNKFQKVFDIDDIVRETIPLSLELESKILN